jgi:hypothetical protein
MPRRSGFATANCRECRRADAGGALGAYRVVERWAAKARWLDGVPEDKKAELLPDAWFKAWAGRCSTRLMVSSVRNREPETGDPDA